jgi:hypothetical protein
MLKIYLDSKLTKLDTKNKGLELTFSIAGCEIVDKDIPPGFQQLPWQWERPNQVALLVIGTGIVLAIAGPIERGPTEILKSVILTIENTEESSELLEYCQNGLSEIFNSDNTLNSNYLKEEAGNYEHQRIIVDERSFSSKDVEKQSFIFSKIATYSQLLPPENEKLGLTFIAKTNDFNIAGAALRPNYEYYAIVPLHDTSQIWPNPDILNENVNFDLQIENRRLIYTSGGHQFIQKINDMPDRHVSPAMLAADMLGYGDVYDYRYNFNQTLSVNDVSELSNVYAEINRRFRYPELLRKLLLQFNFQYDLSEENQKKQFVSNLIISTVDYINRVIYNEGITTTLIHSNSVFEVYKENFKEVVGNCTLNDQFQLDQIGISGMDHTVKQLIDFSLLLKDSNDITLLLSEWKTLLTNIEIEILSLIKETHFQQLNNTGADIEDLNTLVQKIETEHLVTDKFRMDTNSQISRLDRDKFLDSFVRQLGPDMTTFSISPDLSMQIDTDEVREKLISKAQWKEITSIPENIPPAINIDLQIIKDSPAPLPNEISGHIILCRRSDKRNKSYFTSEWKYLNWAKVILEQENAINLEKDYLIPAFLPRINGVQKTSFQLSNESLSLVAGHNSFLNKDEGKISGFKYVFGNPELTETEDIKQFVPPAPALWYGYQYEFAGFVALNSGILPDSLQNGKWNIPKTEEIRIAEDNITRYHHLRKVPIGLPNIEIFTDAENKIVYQNKFLNTPLLINELLNNSDSGDQTRDEPVKAFLLSKDDTKQSQITIEVDKPYTNFWNWYAWKGAQTKKEKINVAGAELTIFSLALQEEAKIKENTYSNSLNEFERKNGIPVKVEKNRYLCEPAIDDEIKIEIEQYFPKLADPPKNLSLKVKQKDGISIKDNFTIKVEGDALTVKGKTISIPIGTICKISIYCKVLKSHFEGDDHMFHPWMYQHIAGKDKSGTALEKGTFYLTNPEIIYVETAIQSDDIFKPGATKENFESLLYNALQPGYTNTNEYGVICKFESENNNQIKYFSRSEVRHQAWNWNGRLFADLEVNKRLDPENKGETTAAMKWEAWEFADRPDFTALVSESSLTANNNMENVNQILFKDVRPQNDAQKAHYFRFGMKLYNRYESIGPGYDKPIMAKDSDIWKRLIKPLQILEQSTFKLPRPAIRFAIPLTDALQTKNDSDHKVRAASMMIATYDRCFDEAGLAEQFEIGIEVAASDENYLQTGEDPILSSKAMGAIDNENVITQSEDGRKFVVFKPIGPAALTFDSNAQSPKIVGSTFILNVEDIQKVLPLGSKLNAYAMAKIAIRRVLNENFVFGTDINTEGRTDDLKKFNSGWSASEWVQFLPAVNSLIPAEWKTNVGDDNSTSFKLKIKELNNIQIAETLVFSGTMPTFDDSFEDRMERYLLLSENITDITGQPVEKYLGVYKWTGKNEPGNLEFKLDDPENLSIQTNEFTGFARLMLVRKTDPAFDSDALKDEAKYKSSIWEKLFGEERTVKFDQIANDPLAAMPLVSKRISIKKTVQTL